MKVLKILVIMLVLIMSVGAVCAADAVSGDDTGSDGQTILETVQENDTLETTQNDFNAVGEASFTDLSHEIGNATGVLELTKDYKFNNETDDEIGIFLSEDNFVIEGNGHTLDANNQARMFIINATNVTLNNLKFINANKTNGGALFVDVGCSLTTNNVTFENNTAGSGVVYVSGTYNSNGDKFLDSTISEGGVIELTYGELNIDGALMRNSKQLVWGFIKSTKSTLTVLNSIFRDTVSNYSAAIRADGKSLIKNTQFINLEAKITAGAIALRELDECIIENCTFDSVRADKNGGAIFADVRGFEHSDEGLLLINGSLFYNCTSGFGGAILHLGGDLVVDDSRFICNIASFDGGAIYVSNSDVAITNSLFDFNWAVYGEDRGSSGGAIFCDKSTFDLSYSNLTNNLAHEGSAVYLYDSSYNIKNNLFEGNTNFEGYDDDIFTVFDADGCALGDNTYSGENSISIDNVDYASIVDFEGMRLVLLNNTINVTTLPSKFDLRELGWLTPVRNQGKKGACWTFGASGAMESAILRFLDLEMDLSENNMEDISLMYYKYGVDGVWEGNVAESATNYALSWFGVFSSDYDVYDQLGKISPIFAVPNSIHFQDVLVIPPRNDLMDNDAMKWAIINYGALFIYYYALGSDVDQYYNGIPQINHGVSLVGWDDDRQIEGAPGKGAWIIKNSWGDAVGENGFMYISYYDTSFSTITSSYAYLLENTVPYNKNYQYDISGVFKYENYSNQYSNSYLAVDDDLLAAVGTYFNDTGVEYTIKIYVNDELKHVQSGLSPFSGFHTVKLDSYVPIKKGDEFIVEIKSNNVPVLVQSRKHYIQGSSQAMTDGEWFNITDYGYVACIKAYTVDSKTFTDLQDDVDNAIDNVLDLDCDYKFDNFTDKSCILITSDNFVINGNNHIIDGNNLINAFRIMAKNVTINNLTIRNTNFDFGSALYLARGCSLTTNNVIFENNTAKEGVMYILGDYVSNGDKIIDATSTKSGVIYVLLGSLEVNNALMMSSNVLSWGFIQTSNCPVTVFNSTFANTTSNYSTAIKAGGKTTIRNSKFTNLEALITAGAIGLKEIDLAIIDNCTFTNVISDKNGGAIFADVMGFKHSEIGEVLINRSTFVNCSSGFGGAVVNLGGNFTILNSQFTDNYAFFDGGAVYTSNANVTISNSAFENNYVLYINGRPSSGGAIFIDLGLLDITDSNFTGNSAQEGGAIYLYDSNYTISGITFKDNVNLEGRYDDVYTVFDGIISILDNSTNVYSGKDSLTLNKTEYATIAPYAGMKLVLINNTIDVSVIPSKFDLRDWGWLTPVKNQGSMGSCWTFGSSGAMESAILRYLGIAVDLSENNMQDVSLKYYKYGMVGVNEGNFMDAPGAYALSWLGVFDDEYDVYDQLGKISPLFATGSSIHFQDIVIIPPRANATDNDLMKMAIMKYGALFINYYAAGSGIEQYYNGTPTINHGVALVGWDDDRQVAGAPDKGAWIIKNSWGENVGENGFMYISYYDTAFSTITPSYAYLLENDIVYNKNYQYDMMGMIEVSDASNQYRNHYMAIDDDLIAGVGTYFYNIGEEYTVKIYVNDVLKHVQNGVAPFIGFHTIKLDSYVPIKEGDMFTVEIKSDATPFMVNSRQHYIEGASQYLVDGSWFNSSDEQKVCPIKAYTVEDDTKVINNNNIAVDYAGGSYFSVKVVTDDGHAVGAGEKVTFKIGSRVATATTDASGIAKVAITDVPKTYNVITSYNGKTYTNKVTVKQVLSTSKVTVKKSSKKFTLKAKLKINGKLVKGKWITFKFKGKTYKAKTNSKGIAQKTLKKSVIKKLKKGKTYTVKVTYLKDTIKTTVKVK